METQHLSEILQNYLRHCGLRTGALARIDAGTRLYHDLGIFGDEAEAYIEALQDSYGVDLGGFKYEFYFPPEFPGNSFITRTLFWIVPFAKNIMVRKSNYHPLTVAMLDHALSTGRWDPGVQTPDVTDGLNQPA